MALDERQGGETRKTMGIRVMTVDDSRSVRSMVRLALQGAGYDVIEAMDGVDALEKLGGVDVRAVIVDVNMPRMDGIEFVRKLRKLPGHQSTPVIILTTEIGENRIEEGKTAGASGWMVKPFIPEQLIDVLTRLMP